MSLFKRGNVWWYSFFFAGQLVRESSRSTSKTIAKSAEQERRRELEAGYNNVKEVRQNRIRTLAEIIVEYLVGYKLRYRSASFAEYALGHVSRLLGSKLVVDINEAAVLGYWKRDGKVSFCTCDHHKNDEDRNVPYNHCEYLGCGNCLGVVKDNTIVSYCTCEHHRGGGSDPLTSGPQDAETTAPSVPRR